MTTPTSSRRHSLLLPPIPPPRPAYLPTTTTTTTPSSPSPLTVSKPLYNTIASAPRTLLTTLTLPIRSGIAFHAPAASIIRISTSWGAQVGDLNIWSATNPREHFWAARTKQLHSSHVSTYDRLWSCLPYMRPMCTIIADTLSWYGVDSTGGRVHDLLGTRCDPYVNVLLSGGEVGGEGGGGGGERGEGSYDYHCHSNLTRAIMPFGLNESDVHDVINLFQVTGLDGEGRYFMNPSPAREGDYIEFFAEQDLLMALSTCPGGDLSRWGFGSSSEKEMVECCRPLKVEVFKLDDEEGVLGGKWKAAERPLYKGLHGMVVPEGEKR